MDKLKFYEFFIKVKYYLQVIVDKIDVFLLVLFLILLLILVILSNVFEQAILLAVKVICLFIDQLYIKYYLLIFCCFIIEWLAIVFCMRYSLMLIYLKTSLSFIGSLLFRCFPTFDRNSIFSLVSLQPDYTSAAFFIMFSKIRKNNKFLLLI